MCFQVTPDFGAVSASLCRELREQGWYQGHLEPEKHVLDAQNELRWIWNSILSGVGHGGWQQAEHKLVFGIDKWISSPPFLYFICIYLFN